MRRDLKFSTPSAVQQGFSMLEILITLVIVATALLGTAGLQIYAMRVNKGSQFRTQAIFLASSIAERMEANKAGAVAGNYVASSAAPATIGTNCETAACDSTNLARYDLSQWEAAITDPLFPLPGASWSITQTTAGNPSTYSILISWTDRSSDKSSHGETFSYTATRTIGN